MKAKRSHQNITVLNVPRDVKQTSRDLDSLLFGRFSISKCQTLIGGVKHNQDFSGQEDNDLNLHQSANRQYI